MVPLQPTILSTEDRWFLKTSSSSLFDEPPMKAGLGIAISQVRTTSPRSLGARNSVAARRNPT
jgi:hypothetical protein